MSTNFKAALVSIFIAGFVLLSSVLYAMQLITVEGVKTQVTIYQNALQTQVHKLSDRIARMEKDVISGSVLLTPVATSTATTTLKK